MLLHPKPVTASPPPPPSGTREKETSQKKPTHQEVEEKEDPAKNPHTTEEHPVGEPRKKEETPARVKTEEEEEEPSKVETVPHPSPPRLASKSPSTREYSPPRPVFDETLTKSFLRVYKSMFTYEDETLTPEMYQALDCGKPVEIDYDAYLGLKDQLLMP